MERARGSGWPMGRDGRNVFVAWSIPRGGARNTNVDAVSETSEPKSILGGNDPTPELGWSTEGHGGNRGAREWLPTWCQGDRRRRSWVREPCGMLVDSDRAVAAKPPGNAAPTESGSPAIILSSCDL